MDPLSIAASITALLQVTSTLIKYANGVKGASEERRKILSELLDIKGILFCLKDEADHAKQNDQWSSTFESLSVPGGPLESFGRIVEDLSSKLAPPATKSKKVREVITWPFKKEEVKEILGSIERQKALFLLARQNDHIKLSRAIKDDVSFIRNELGEVAIGIKTIQRSQITSEQQKIVKWLDVPDPSTNFNKALKIRNPKTGSWFIANEINDIYKDWRTTRGSFLWLHGIAGSGKTILCTTIIENVLNLHDIKPASAVLFFYFDFNDTEKQRHEKMIRSLICQLSRYRANTILHELYKTCSNGNRQPTEEMLLNTLRQMMVTLDDTYIILDSLDECTERSELLTNLKQIISWKDANLHILVTSRRERDIEEALTPLIEPEEPISIQSAVVNADIRVYVQDRLQNDPKLKRWTNTPNVQQEIVSTLMSKADGMFRWAACQLDALGDCFNLPLLRGALATLPKTLDDTYARILCNIDEQYNSYKNEVLKVLQWLTFSARPLQLGELAEIVAIDINGTPRFDPERRWPDPGDILKLCSSLVTLTTDEYDTSGDASGVESSGAVQFGASESAVSEAYVRLAHFSVKEYLVSNKMQPGTAAQYRIQEAESHSVIAEECIAYLLQFDQPSLTYKTINLSPLAWYAAKYWVNHAKRAEEGSTESTTLLSMELLDLRGQECLNWIRIADPDSNWKRDPRKGPEGLATPLYYASLTNLVKSVKMLIQRGTDINAQAGRYGSAIQAASLEGHTGVVQVLVDNGADVNIQGGVYGNALQAASSNGHKEIMQILLDNEADVNAEGGSYGTALRAASQTGNREIVKVLLDNGAHINAQGRRYGTALHEASLSGHIETMQFLLDHGANINARGESYGTALQEACSSGHADAVQLLLDNHADPHILVGKSRSALIEACYGSSEKIVKMLLDKGVGDTAQADGSMYYALRHASGVGYEGIVMMLIDHGADVKKDGEAALEAATANGHAHIVQLLMKNGAVMPEEGFGPNLEHLVMLPTGTQ